jgi:hypothetical protein
MTFCSRPATLAIQNPAIKASDIKYADLDQSTHYSRLTLKYIGQFYAIFSLYISSELNAAYEPGGQEFESLRARQMIQIVSRGRARLFDIEPGTR